MQQPFEQGNQGGKSGSFQILGSKRIRQDPQDPVGSKKIQKEPKGSERIQKDPKGSDRIYRNTIQCQCKIRKLVISSY